MKNYWQNEFVVYGFFLFFFILDTFISIAVFATAMQLCWKRISATQFTLFMAFANLGLAAGARLLGPLTENLNWEYVILTVVVFVAVMLVLIRYIHFDSHLIKVNRLEAMQLLADNQADQHVPGKIRITT